MIGWGSSLLPDDISKSTRKSLCECEILLRVSPEFLSICDDELSF